MFLFWRGSIRVIKSSTRSTSVQAARLYSAERLEEYDAPVSADDNFTSVRRDEFKSLRIAIFGLPNAGKSTLINQLIHHQVCAASMKPHTTRSACRAVLHTDTTELVFVDTPGVVTTQEVKRLNLESSFQSDPEVAVKKADIVGVLHDVSRSRFRQEISPQVLNLLKNLDSDTPTLLLMNKVDQIKNKRKLLDFVRHLTGENGWPNFTDIFMLSALEGDGVSDLREYLLVSAKPRDWEYEKDTLTDQKPEEMIVRIVRGSLLDVLPEEIPYNLDIQIEYYNVCKDGSINTVVLIDCPTERLYKLILRKITSKLKYIAMNVEQALSKNLQQTVRVKLVFQPKKVISKSK
ncbi:GTPase Era, mitochondrial [Diprion similis]|uniref:GTPase Era, mitochondrial n=1 Tax=Diprion similis TaxID=362088 RepID=UPI001EF7D30F|nr:GTPase Era, mitochondrial [Diprion similis]